MNKTRGQGYLKNSTGAKFEIEYHKGEVEKVEEVFYFKAEEAGREVIEVPARNTSQMCSSCGVIVKKDLSVRVHSCSCGLVIDRDYNSALNILRLGQSLQGVETLVSALN